MKAKSFRRDIFETRPETARVALIGAPYDHNSSFLRGSSQAPAKIREALACDASHCWTELGIDAADPARVIDVGDLSSDEATWADAIDDAIRGAVDAGLCPLVLGGDHAVTFPVVRALRRLPEPPTILHFDAHPDLYDDFDGNPHSHASPFARIMEAGLARRLVSVGIRTLNPSLRAQCDRFAVDVVEMRDLAAWHTLPPFEGPLYISFDMDALDPAAAPGVSHWEPGGLTVRQALDFLHSEQVARVPVVGADVVELNPRRDIVGPGGVGFTATVAAKIAKELTALMLRSTD